MSEHFSENVAVRTTTLHELGRYLIDLSGEEKVVSDGYQVEELPRTLVAELVEWLRLDLGCDHSVGICYCREAGLVEALMLAFEGKIVCPACLGDGYLWDQAAWDKANAYCERVLGMTASDSDGMVPCTTCHCSGKILASTPAVEQQR